MLYDYRIICYNPYMVTEIKKLQDVLQQDPSNFQIRRELSILLANEGFNEEALSNLQFLLKYFPEDAELNYNIGILHEKMKDFEKAKIAYEKAIAISPQEDFYYNLGEVLISLELWDEAIEAFKTVLKTDSKDGNCYFNLGLCYYRKDEVKRATDNFQKAVELNPRDIFAHFYLGNIYQNDGLTNFAQKCYKKVLELSPDYSWAYFNLASIAFQNNNLEEAKEYLLKTIECNKYDFEAYKLLTKICLKTNEVEEIITILETRLENDGNGDLFYILAQVYKQVGDKNNYLKNLKKALENNLTLTYSHKWVNKELNKIKLDEDLDVDEFEEYDSDFRQENSEEVFEQNEDEIEEVSEHHDEIDDSEESVSEENDDEYNIDEDNEEV